MYLFFFAVLFIIFQYMNEKQIYESQESQIAVLTKKLETTEARKRFVNISNDGC